MLEEKIKNILHNRGTAALIVLEIILLAICAIILARCEGDFALATFIYLSSVLIIIFN